LTLNVCSWSAPEIRRLLDIRWPPVEPNFRSRPKGDLLIRGPHDRYLFPVGAKDFFLSIAAELYVRG
jgi:hypothetical protein